MDWRALPPEMEEAILAKLSLIDLARVSPTCRTFHAVFCMRLPVEQRARCDLAAERFGRKRIARIIELLDRKLKGRTLEPHMSDRHGHASPCWICEDGTCQSDIPAPSRDENGTPHNAQIRVSARLDGWRAPYNLLVDVMLEGHGPLMVLQAKLEDTEKAMFIWVVHPHNHDVEGPALLQALLSGGLAQSCRDVGQHATIRLIGVRFSRSTTLTGLKALVAPLLPLMSRMSQVGCRFNVTCLEGEVM